MSFGKWNLSNEDSTAEVLGIHINEIHFGRGIRKKEYVILMEMQVTDIK